MKVINVIFQIFMGIVLIEDEDVQISEEERILTAQTVNFLNNLFDCVNGDKRDNNNEFRCLVTKKQ